MNKIILTAAIRLLPNKLQSRAVSKALNYVISAQSLDSSKVTSLAINIIDLKKSWRFSVSSRGFEPVNDSSTYSGLVTVAASLLTFHSIQTKQDLIKALDVGELVVSGETAEKEYVVSVLKAVDAHKITSLIGHGYSFLRIKRPEKWTIHNVTLQDIKGPADVDFLRDEALRLESTNLELALKLMGIAQQARPKGTLISRKVEEYRAALKAE
ncbi:hypothetical protein ACVFI8_02560 [Agarivorans sp. MS3-6]